MATKKPDAVEDVAEEAPKEKKTKKSNATAIAKEILAGTGSWGTGRDRDEKLKKAGHDPNEVRQEVYRLRAEES